MRLLPCLAALVLATTTLSTQIADACGGYDQYRRTPRVTLISSHTTHMMNEGEAPTWSTRAFVVLAERSDVTGTDFWPFVAPMTFDTTRIDDGAVMRAETVTLVGPSGTREVTAAAQRVLLAGAFFMRDKVFEAAEVPMGTNDDFAIAIRGRAPTAKWHGLEYTARGRTRVGGTSLWIEQTWENDTGGVTVRDGKRALGSFGGTALGVLAVDGSHYLVAKVNGHARAFELAL